MRPCVAPSGTRGFPRPSPLAYSVPGKRPSSACRRAKPVQRQRSACRNRRLSNRTVAIEGESCVFSPELHSVVVCTTNHCRLSAAIFLQSGDVPACEVIRATIKSTIASEFFESGVMQQSCKHVVTNIARGEGSTQASNRPVRLQPSRQSSQRLHQVSLSFNRLQLVKSDWRRRIVDIFVDGLAFWVAGNRSIHAVLQARAPGPKPDGL